MARKRQGLWEKKRFKHVDRWFSRESDAQDVVRGFPTRDSNDMFALYLHLDHASNSLQDPRVYGTYAAVKAPA